MSSLSIATIKSTYERTKSKLLSKGDVDVDDTEYFQEKEKVIFLEQVMNRINKRTKKSLEIFQEMSRLQSDMVNDIQTMYDPGDKTHTTVLLMREAASSMEAERQKMTERMEKNALRPMDDYCAQFKEVRRRMEEYTHRKSEMERLKSELSKLQAKGPVNNPKLAVTEEKYKYSIQSYEEMREELLRDLPALNNDRGNMLGFLLACSIRSQSDFYTGLSEKYNVISPLAASIDQSSLIHHQHVITSPEKSAAATNLRSHPVFLKDGNRQSTQISTSPPSNRQTVSSPPPSQYQQQPPTQYQQQPVVSLQKQQPPPSSIPATSPTPGNDDTPLPSVNPFSTPYQPPPQQQPVISLQKQQAPQEQQHQQENSSAPPEDGVLLVPIKAQGLYDFTASEENELSFRKGDVLSIVAKHGDWWEAELNGTVGLLPSNYVREL